VAASHAVERVREAIAAEILEDAKALLEELETG
jgi:hypothetical protein